MIDLVDLKRKVIFHTDTDNQEAVEHFCISVGGTYNHNGNMIFCNSDYTKTFIKDEKKRISDFINTSVKVKILKKKYKFII
jgi:hypothetical protein